MKWVIFFGWWLDAFMSALLCTSGRCGDTSEGAKMQWYWVYFYATKTSTPTIVDGVFAPDRYSAQCIAEMRHGLKQGQMLMCFVVLTNQQQNAAQQLHASTNARIEEFEIFMTLRTKDRAKTESGRGSED